MSLPGESQSTPTSVAEFESNHNNNNASALKNNSDSDADVLQDSDMTNLSTETLEESGGGGWFGGMGTDFRNMAYSLKDAVPPTIGDIASFVQRSARSVAAEIAMLERDSDDDEGDLEHALRLPWEISTGLTSSDGSTEYQEDEELKAKVLTLSVSHASFLTPFNGKEPSFAPGQEESNFVAMDEPRIHLIRRLLEIDENLAVTHAHLSGRSDVKEAVFWTNYFFNCEKLRREHLEYLQSLSLVSTLSTPGENAETANVNDETADENASEVSQNSLIPVDDRSIISQAVEDDGNAVDDNDDDDSSYIQVKSFKGIVSSPCSLKSVESLVLVNKIISEKSTK